MKSLKALSTFILCFTLFSSYAQLKWLVEPIIEQEKFFYYPASWQGYIKVIDPSGKEGLLKSNGEYFLEPGRLSRIQIISANGIVYGLSEDKKTVVFNSDGKILSDAYDDLNSYHRTNILLVKNDDLYGLIDTLGTVIRKPQYKMLHRVQRGVYKGTLLDGTEEIIKVEETDGGMSSQLSKSYKINSKKIKDRVIITAKSKKRGSTFYGFTNMKGETILAPDRYYSNYNCMGFDNQVMIALDSQTDKAGLFDKDANIVIPFEYDKIWSGFVANDYVIANKGKDYYLINVDGNIRASIVADAVYPMRKHPYVKAKINEKYQFLNLDLEQVVPGEFKSVRDPFKNNWTILSREGERGLFSLRTGKYTVLPFTKISVPLIYDVFGLKNKKHYGLFDVHKGVFVTDTIFNRINRSGGSFYIGITVQKDSVLQDGKYKPRTIRNYQVIDSTGKVLYGPVPNMISHTWGSIYWEKISKDHVILHDFIRGTKKSLEKKGIRFYKNNVIQIDKNEYCFIDEFFDEDNPRIFEHLSHEITENLRVFKINGKSGLFHNKEIVAEAKFDQIRDIRDGEIKVKLNGKWGILENPFHE